MKNRIQLAGLLSLACLVSACSDNSESSSEVKAAAPDEAMPAPMAIPSPTGYLVNVNGLEGEKGRVRIRRAPDEEMDGSLVLLLTADNVQALSVRGRAPSFDILHEFLANGEIKIVFGETEEDSYPMSVYERTDEGWGEPVWNGAQAVKTIADASEWSLDTWRSEEQRSSGIDIQVFEYRSGARLLGFQLAGEIFEVVEL